MLAQRLCHAAGHSKNNMNMIGHELFADHFHLRGELMDAKQMRLDKPAKL